MEKDLQDYIEKLKERTLDTKDLKKAILRIKTRLDDLFECCEAEEIHKDLIEKVNQNMPDEEDLYSLSELFKTFGEPTRIRILFVLSEAEVCVCDLAQILNMTQRITRTPTTNSTVCRELFPLLPAPES